MMQHARFLGVGIPPRPGRCKWCGRPIAIGDQAVYDSQAWCPDYYCSTNCFTGTTPATPAEPSLSDPHPASDDNDAW